MVHLSVYVYAHGCGSLCCLQYHLSCVLSSFSLSLLSLSACLSCYLCIVSQANFFPYGQQADTHTHTHCLSSFFLLSLSQKRNS